MDNENTLPQFMNTKQSLFLPEDIIEETLSILPVKSLLRLRCVSKSWRSLIDSKRFSKTLVEKSRKNGVLHVMFNCNSENPVPGLKQCSFHSFMHDPDVDPSPIDYPINNHLMTDSDIIVVGHCNGLLCILKQPDCLFLWNPTTRISTVLPNVGIKILKYGFGWDEESDAYKVFAVVPKNNENELIGRVYTTKTNSWKTIEHGSLDLYIRVRGEFAGGKIHWIMRDRCHIEYLDLKSEVFGMTELPCKLKDGLWLKLSQINGCLILHCNSKTQTDEWIMNEERWMKATTAPIPPKSSYMVRGSTDKGVVKFWTRKKIVGCDQPQLYIESLVSPVPDKHD